VGWSPRREALASPKEPQPAAEEPQPAEEQEPQPFTQGPEEQEPPAQSFTQQTKWKPQALTQQKSRKVRHGREHQCRTCFGSHRRKR